MLNIKTYYWAILECCCGGLSNIYQIWSWLNIREAPFDNTEVSRKKRKLRYDDNGYLLKFKIIWNSTLIGNVGPCPNTSSTFGRWIVIWFDFKISEQKATLRINMVNYLAFFQMINLTNSRSKSRFWPLRFQICTVSPLILISRRRHTVMHIRRELSDYTIVENDFKRPTKPICQFHMQIDSLGPLAFFT